MGFPSLTGSNLADQVTKTDESASNIVLGALGKLEDALVNVGENKPDSVVVYLGSQVRCCGCCSGRRLC